MDVTGYVVCFFILVCTGAFKFDGQLQFYPLGDHYLIVGSHLLVNCTLIRYGTEFDLNNVYIKKGVENVSNAQFMRYEDAGTLQMYISNVSVEDSGSYLCYYGDDVRIQSLTEVSVAEMPGRPSNISCVSYQLLDMTCSFNLSKPSTIPMQWRMEYQFRGKPEHEVNCSNVTESVVYCPTFPNNTLIKFRQYEVFVEGMNEMYNVSTNQVFEVGTNYSIAKFGPVQHLDVTVGTRDLMIQWERPKFVAYIPSLVYEYRVSVESRLHTFMQIVQGSKNRTVSLSKEGLIPYVEYNISVWGRSADAEGDIYWSEPSKQEVITLPEVPPYSVTMETGSYVLFDCGGYMCAVLYWKNPEERYWYGQITGYEVVIETDMSEQTVHPRRLVSEMESQSAVVVDRNGLKGYLRLNETLEKSMGYRLIISLLNMAGKSIEHTHLSIPPWDLGKSLQTSWVAVEILSYAASISICE